jgi:hypothetical protein
MLKINYRFHRKIFHLIQNSKFKIQNYTSCMLGDYLVLLYF